MRMNPRSPWDPFYFPSPEEIEQARIEREHAIAAAYQRRLALPTKNWNPDFKWTTPGDWGHEIKIRTSSFLPYLHDLFPELAPVVFPTERKPEPEDICVAYSPSTQFCYAKGILPALTPIKLIVGRESGYVMFDEDVALPSLFEKRRWYPDQPIEQQSYGTPPWMGLTPFEMISLHPGYKLAKGDVVIAGMGLGHQLIEVSHKPGVKSITLVELRQELVDWLLPRILRYVKPSMPFQVIVGDAYEVVPTLTADVALIDIFQPYGNNARRWIHRLARSSTVPPQARAQLEASLEWSPHQPWWPSRWSRRAPGTPEPKYYETRPKRPTDRQLMPGIKKVWIWGSLPLGKGRG